MKILFFAITASGLLFFSISHAQNAGMSITDCSRKLTHKTLTDDFALKQELNKSDHTNITGMPGLFNVLTRYRDMVLPHIPHGTSKQSDTLFVGPGPGDSLIITGNYLQNGPIVVYGDGKLRIKNANVTVLGNIWIWGGSAEMTVDSSTVYCPQQYFYQRELITVGAGKAIIRNSTMDYGGLSHSIGTTDSSLVWMENVTIHGFTTAALFGKSKIHINHSNQAGEFVIDGNSQVSVHNAATVLLWHVFPDGSDIVFDFPDSGYVASYSFSDATPGIDGIGYDIQLSNCTDVMWGIMPSGGSDVTIANSIIRAIGIWFTGNDTLQVNGLVNNSYYNSFIANLPDRHLELQSCQVQTWSLYIYDDMVLDVTGCILGEIGVMGNASVSCYNIFVDGSGGYTWGTDNTLTWCGWSSMATEVRSSGNGIFIFGYSSLMNDRAVATENSVMIVIQSNLPQDPVAIDGGCAWFANIGQLASPCVEQNIPVTGSAWIDKTPNSWLMDFAWYQLFYRKDGDTAWTPITGKVYNEIHNGILATWNTQGMLPGNYILRLLLCDNSPDSNQVEGIKGVDLLPAIFGTAEPESNHFTVFPNPAQGKLFIECGFASNKCGTLNIYDIYGNAVISDIVTGSGNSVDISKLPNGIYIIELRESDRAIRKKFIKSR